MCAHLSFSHQSHVSPSSFLQTAQKYLHPVDDRRWNVNTANSEVVDIISRLQKLRSMAKSLHSKGPQVLSTAVKVADAYEGELQVVGEQIYANMQGGGMPAPNQLACRCIDAIACEKDLTRAVQAGHHATAAAQGSYEDETGKDGSSRLATLSTTLFSPLSCTLDSSETKTDVAYKEGARTQACAP